MAEYLVRGALLSCQCGSHPRRLNLPKCHGIYYGEHPMMGEMDCIIEENISYFGVCSSSTPPANAETITLAAYSENVESGEVVEGFICCPNIIGTWRNPHDTSQISKGEAAITTDSYLICSCGGLIQPMTSGQEYEEDE
ncbi:DUF4280 domain-containing protein [Lachnotalea glycerini]|uniref:DUF4280 domain-containing protein n=1 Tax=Lachnotalea glycerini TaxID=1763509 RepID=A0A371JHL2_9FIRM|nr:DUF4280 domain-containing protein [Lachnotalea glycerini]RDY32219.1 DUF4280 domain-containing protein [Lachnotalea glycerini]